MKRYFASSRGGKKSPISQINTTPFVDVMLVLLVIFIVSAPLIESGLVVQIPEAKRTSPLPDTKDKIIITVNKKEEIFIQDEKVLPSFFMKKLQSSIVTSSSPIVYIKAHHTLPYKKVVQIIDWAHQCGCLKISLVVTPSANPS